MSDYSRWIDWFRRTGAGLPAQPVAPSVGAPGFDRERFDRVLKGSKSSAVVRDLDLNKSLSPAQRMINWLKTQPADVVDATAQHLNWDQAEDVILWLLEQPTTNAATAVKLFMRSEPVCYADSKADDPYYDVDPFVEKVAQTFAANWTASRYARGGVGYDPSDVSPYGTSDIFFINELNEALAKHRANGLYPLPALPGLAGPFEGPRPKEFDDYLKAFGRSELFFVRFLFAGLGTWIIDDDINEADFDAWLRTNGLDLE